MYQSWIPRFSTTVLIAAMFFGTTSCKKKKAPPVQPVPEPILSSSDVSAAKQALHEDLEVASRALCRRKPALGKTLPGESTRALANLLKDTATIEACAVKDGRKKDGNEQTRAPDETKAPGKTHQAKALDKADKSTKTNAADEHHKTNKTTETSQPNETPPSAKTQATASDRIQSPCSRLWSRLRNILSHEAVCSPFAMTSRSGDRPPQIRRAVRFVDVLLGDVSRIAKRSPNQALDRLLLVTMLLEDFQRGPVPWAVAVALTSIWPKLGEAFATVLSRLRHPSRQLPEKVTNLRRALPSLRSVLLGEHLHRLASAGLLPGRVDLSKAAFPALDAKGRSPLDQQALADHQALALLLARHFYRRALAGCRGRSLAVCRSALHQIQTSTSPDQLVEKLHRIFLVRFQSFSQFRDLVLSALAPRDGKKQTEDQAASLYWNELVTWTRAWNDDNIPLLARPGFVLAAVGYHVKVLRFLARHPTRAIYSQVAPFVFSFSEPYSGKPIVAKPSGHNVEVTPPSQASDLKISPYVIRLKH